MLYGTLAEIFGRENGFNRGLGGSMHAFFTPFGSYPNNAIVGGSGDISVGAGLYKRINRKPGIVVGNIGDASSGCGPVWEGLMIAAMDQYRTLWDKDLGGAPPVMINFFNNFYGMGGQTSGETMGFHILARLGAGINPENMHAERVDGYNPIAVAEAMERKKKILLEGRGPVLLDTITYRISGHSPSDASSYRTKEETAMWEDPDCIKEFGEYLSTNGVLSEDDMGAYKERVTAKMTNALTLSASTEISPRINPKYIETVMFSNETGEKLDDRKPDTLKKKADVSRVKSISKKARFGLDEKGAPLPKTKVFALRDALFEGDASQVLRRPYYDSLRGREQRLGRGLRGLPRPNRGDAVPQAL